MTKVSKKTEIITAFGGIFFVLDKFNRFLSSVIDSHLGIRSTQTGYQYSEIIRAIFSVFFCGGDYMEDLNLYLKEMLALDAAACGEKAADNAGDVPSDVELHGVIDTYTFYAKNETANA